MRAYIITTGVTFGLITLSHVARVFLEGRRLATEPWFVLITFAAAGLTVWAWRLIRVQREPGAGEPG